MIKKITVIAVAMSLNAMLISCSCKQIGAKTKPVRPVTKTDTIVIQAACGHCGKSSCTKSCTPNK